jgi:hypothetical protein
VKLLRDNYNTTVTPVDFVNNAPAVRSKINSWARKATRDGIENFLPQSPSPETGLLFLNSAYFRGYWLHHFDSAKDAPFFLDETRTVTIPLMYKEERFLYGETEDFQMVKIPYSGERDEGCFSMLIFLPKKKTPGALKELEQSLVALRKLDLWRKSMSLQKVKLSLPKFSFNSEIPLTGTLKTMGIRDVFSNAADFSNINEEKNLFLSGIQHKTFIRVDEKGTAAGANTNMVFLFGISTREREPAVFRADHPFLFLICEEKDGILFMGRMNHPEETKIFRDMRVALEKDKSGKHSRGLRMAGYDLTASLLWQADRVSGWKRELLLEEAEEICRSILSRGTMNDDRVVIHGYLAEIFLMQSTEFVTRSGKKRLMREAIVELEEALKEIPERPHEWPQLIEQRAELRKRLENIRTDLENGNLAEAFLAQAAREELHMQKVRLLQEAIALFEEALREIPGNSTREQDEQGEQWRKKLESVRAEEAKLRGEWEKIRTERQESWK